MSKLTKLINDPKQFFWDVRTVKMVRNAMPFEIYMKNSSTKTIPNKILNIGESKNLDSSKPNDTISSKKEKQSMKKPIIEEIVQIKNSFTSVINAVPISNVSLMHHEVAMYFSGSMGNIYQLEQWLGPLIFLNKITPMIIITRVKEVYDWLTINTHFVIVYCRTIQDLTDLYECSNLKCILYVNHGFKNFQSLMNHKALHIHINHGESDKTSTITNQAKSYDYVYVVAQAGYDKYDKNLIKKDMQKYIKVGRPQLEHIPKIEQLKTDKSIVLYAPTWEGTHESMNFSSLQEYGLSIVQKLIDNSDYFIIYKPHPNTGSRDTKIKKINEEIINILKKHPDAEVLLSGDINSIYPQVDICIFDNSAVAIDYLITNKPMLMTDMFHRIKGRVDKPIITGAARMLKPSDAINIDNIVKEELSLDTKIEDRKKIKDYFLGNFDYDNGESTSTFITKILEACKERDSLLKEITANK